MLEQRLKADRLLIGCTGGRLGVRVSGGSDESRKALTERLLGAAKGSGPGEAPVAEVVIALVDAQGGSLTETERAGLVAALLGIRNVVVAVDMDAAGHAEAAFSRVEAEYRQFAEQSQLFSASCVPISVARGDNVSERSANMPWYRGPTLLEWLDALPADDRWRRERPLRLPVSSVEASGSAGRVLGGTVASGRLRKGDAVRLQPSGRVTRVTGIFQGERETDEAFAGDAVTLHIADGLEVSVGELVVAAASPAELADQFEATIVWTGSKPLLRSRSYVMRSGPTAVGVTIAPLKYKLSLESLERVAAAKLEAGEVGVCGLQLESSIAFDPYRENPATGAFTLVDPLSGETVGRGFLHFALRRAKNVHWQAVDVNKAARAAAKGQRPCVLWYTGLSGAGKSTIANLVDKKLHAMSRHTYLLDGDNVRHGLNKDLGFTAADRVENIRRIAEVAKLMVDAGLIVGTAFISPFRAERQMARSLLADGEFVEIFVDTPLSVAEQRDPKGLYKKARRGELKNFTGIDSPYEPPESPELRLDTTHLSPEAAADQVIAFLRERGIIDLEPT